MIINNQTEGVLTYNPTNNPVGILRLRRWQSVVADHRNAGGSEGREGETDVNIRAAERRRPRDYRCSSDWGRDLGV